MADPLSITISALALGVSSVTAWLTLFRRGTVKMTQPTVIYFGPDFPRGQADSPLPKVYMRTLLFATSKRGRMIESMHVALSRNETHQNFNIWVYGEDRLVRGSGLFVGETGVEANHHFLTPKTPLQSTSLKAAIDWMSSPVSSEIKSRRGSFRKRSKFPAR